MNAVVAQTRPAQRALATHWIRSPAWDGFWMFAGLWAPALTLLVHFTLRALSDDPSKVELPVQTAPALALLYLPLSILHRIGTTFSILGTPILRDDIRARPGRYVYVPAAIAFACFALSQCFVFHSAFSFMPAIPGQLWAFFALAYVTVLWERWHFCAQEFGVLSIYRARAGQFAPADKRFDRLYTVVLMMGVNMVLFFCLGFADVRDVLFHGTALSAYRGEWLDHVATAAFVLGLGVILAALVREWRHPQRSIPKLLFYALVGAHTVLLYTYPRGMGVFFLNYVFHHWLVAIALFGRVSIQPGAGESALRSFGRLALRLGPLLALLFVWYVVYGDLYKSANLAPVPDTRWFEGATTAAKILVGFGIGVFFTIDFLHYYYDRCFYNFSNPAVRKQVAPLVIGATSAK